MDSAWIVPGGDVLVRRGPQSAPCQRADGAPEVEDIFDFDRVDRRRGTVLERFRRSCALGDGPESYRWTVHRVEGRELRELTLLQATADEKGSGPCLLEGQRVLIGELVRLLGRRWRTADGEVLVHVDQNVLEDPEQKGRCHTGEPWVFPRKQPAASPATSPC